MAQGLRLLEDLRLDLVEARRELDQAVVERFPKGCRVHVHWGRHQTPARVVEARGFENVLVRSIHGKEYRVEATRLVEFARR